MSEERNVILAMKGITKVYPNGVIANKDVNLECYEGEIHALSGENGAGKTTLMKQLFGIEKSDSGDVFIKGEKVTDIHSPMDAIRHGIGMVHQHFMLVDQLTVAQNMILGMEPVGKLGLIDEHKMVEECRAISEKYNLLIDPNETVGNLSVGSKQKVEILKALLRGAEILILDEPTAVLTPQETEELFKNLKDFKKTGHTIIFISHKLREVKELCDRITILRNGTTRGTFNIDEVTEADISRLMVGRDVLLTVEKDKAVPKETVLSVKNLSVKTEAGTEALKNVSFLVRKGAILGVAGVEGNGQNELISAVTGFAPRYGGEIDFDGMDLRGKDIREIREHGMAYIPQDRMTMGVASPSSIADNLVADRYYSGNYSGKFFLNQKAIQSTADSLIDEYGILCTGADQQIGSLSGGNMQKVVVAREFSSNPKLVIAEQPTRGIDVGATEFIRRRLVEMRDDGAGVLLVSADLNEILELSDSLIVLYDGEIVGYFKDCAELTEEELGLYMLGIKRMSAQEQVFEEA